MDRHGKNANIRPVQRVVVTGTTSRNSPGELSFGKMGFRLDQNPVWNKIRHLPGGLEASEHGQCHQQPQCRGSRPRFAVERV
jgi:hypothetical protein